VLEYFSERELSYQTGHSREQWPIVILKVNHIIDSSAQHLTPGEIYSQLVLAGEVESSPGRYGGFIRHLVKARKAGQVDNSRIAEGRGRKGNKFDVGDRVRVNRHNKRTPLWLRQQLRLDAPRTITAFFRTGRRIRYYLGSNGLGSGILTSYAFRSCELIPYVKGKVGRPRRKRPYCKKRFPL